MRLQNTVYWKHTKLVTLALLVTVAVTSLVASLYLVIRLISLAGGFEIDRFEDSNILVRAVFPFVGCLFIVWLARLLDVDGREVGGTHVLRRIEHHQGQFVWRNALMQYGSAAVALSTGFSGGKDGPGLHLGAWTAFAVHKRLGLDQADLELLLKVGMTAAIAAGFHTPVAAALFVTAFFKFGEYSSSAWRSFILLAAPAIVATLLAKWLGVPQLEGGSQIYTSLTLMECGLAIIFLALILSAGIATMYLVVTFSKVEVSFTVRMQAITIVTAILALMLPEVLGMGLDTFRALQGGQLEAGMGFLFAFLIAKLLLTSVSVAFGVPVGVIAPALVNGGALGALFYTVMVWLFPEWIVAPVGVYVTFGAVGLLGVVFHNPFAAGIMFYELTHSAWLTLQIALGIFLLHQCKIRLWGNKSIFEARLAVFVPKNSPEHSQH